MKLFEKILLINWCVVWAGNALLHKSTLWTMETYEYVRTGYPPQNP